MRSYIILYVIAYMLLLSIIYLPLGSHQHIYYIRFILYTLIFKKEALNSTKLKQIRNQMNKLNGKKTF